MNKNPYGSFKDWDISDDKLPVVFKYYNDTGLPIKVGDTCYQITSASSTASTKQDRYLGKSKEDLIDRWAREHAPGVFRAKMLAQFDRYTCRYGEKDDPLIEAKKLLDYANRLVQYEQGLLNE